MMAAIARVGRLLLALGLCAAPGACVACGGTSPGPSVTIMIPWTGEENHAFMTVIRQFTKKTGIQVNPEVTRAVSQELDADLAAGDPPDVVDLPNPGTAYQYLGNGLMPLGVNLGDYAQPWRGLAMLNTSKVYVVPVKADVKSLIWYSTSAATSPPRSWTELESLSKHGAPWCLGLASGAASGWPGADWIADIMLSMYSVGNYEKWLNGKLSWNSAQVREAWQEWGKLMGGGAAVRGGVSGALTTPYNQALPAGQCALDHGALSATGLTSTTGYNYVRFPSASGAASPVMVSGDFMGLFTDNPNARKLLTFLSFKEAQALWVSQSGGHAFSADEKVPLNRYPSRVEQSIAGLLQPGAGSTLCFSAGDLMVADVSAAFSQAVLDYVAAHYHNLNDLLKGLRLTQQGAGSSPVWNLACSGPGAS